MIGHPEGGTHEAQGPAELDDLADLIRDEMARMRAEQWRFEPATPGSERAAAVAAAPFLPRLAGDTSRIAEQTRYHVRDLFAYHDEQFVRNAYRAILRREPDVQGLGDHLASLRSGEFAKVEILAHIRYSKEGRRTKVAVRGLALPFVLRSLRRVPVVGRVVGIVQYAFRLPDIVRMHERFEAGYFHREAEQRKRVNTLIADIEEAIQARFALAESKAQALVAPFTAAIASSRDGMVDLRAELATMRGELHETARRTELERLERDDLQRQALTTRRLDQLEREALDGQAQAVARLDAVDAALASVVQELRAKHAEFDRKSRELAERPAPGIEPLQRSIEAIHRQLVLQRREMGRLEDASAASAIPSAPAFAAAGAATVAAHDAALAAFYVSFEDRFRGTRDDIKQRMRVHLPAMEAAGAGTLQSPIIDLGCGRGEWLELVGEQGRVGRGVDANPVMVRECRERGIDVSEADMLEALRALGPATAGAITAMHVIEHVPFEQIVALVDEAMRALVPGGVLVFETPNPENLIVGACNFYADPTHRRPLPPELMRFVLESRGFARVDIERLHPFPESQRLRDGEPAWRDTLNALLFGPQDYAVIASKA